MLVEFFKPVVAVPTANLLFFTFLFDYLFVVQCVCVCCFHVYLCSICVSRCLWRPKENRTSPATCDWSYGGWWTIILVLGLKPGSSGRADGTLGHWATSPDLLSDYLCSCCHIILFIVIHVHISKFTITCFKMCKSVVLNLVWCCATITVHLWSSFF